MHTMSAVLYAYKAPFRVEEVELDSPKASEVLVRLVASGVCHSDYHSFSGDFPTPLPMICGHEGAGIVEQVGSEVTICKVGDHVVLSWVPVCEKCAFCLSGQPNLCDQGQVSMAGSQLDGTYRFHKSGRDIGQYCLISTFSRHTVVPASSVAPVSKEVPLEYAALLGCAVLTGYGAAVNRVRVQPGSSVIVFGCGGIGVNVIQGAAIAGAETIIAVDVVDFKLEQARLFGATHTVNTNQENPVAFARQLTNGLGVNYAFEAIGNSKTIAQAYKATRRGGCLCLIGLTAADVNHLDISPVNLVLTEKTIMGTVYGGVNPRRDIPTLLDLYRQGKLKLSELVTREYRLEQINEAYDDMIAGRTLRGLIRF